MMPSDYCRLIGLTGTIASGKSAVCRYLKERYDAVFIDADLVARDVVSEMAPRLAEVFGEEILRDGQLDRKALGSIVFSNPEKLQVLNGMVHPETCRRIEEQVQGLREEAERTKTLKIAVVEAIELLRTPLKDLVDQIWVVYADPKIRLKRMMEERAMTEEEAAARIQSQWDDETYLSHADRILKSGEGPILRLYRQVDDAVAALL